LIRIFKFQQIIKFILDLAVVGRKNDKDAGVTIFTHKKFEIGYNENQIVEVVMTPEKPVQIEKGVKLEFSYEVM